MTAIDDVLFVVNPGAASGRASRVWYTLRQRVRSLRSAQFVECRETASAAAAIVDALTPRIRRVIVVGGDGTLHCVLNLLMADVPAGRSLGLVPIGTGSDLARGLGLETRPEHALARALETDPAPIDVLRLTAGGQSRYCINEISLGLSAVVAARVNALVKRNALTFLHATLRELVAYEPRWARIRLDGRDWWEGPHYLAIVANGSHFGRGMRIAPTANPRDGLAEVIVIEAAPRALALAWLPSLYFGRSLAAPFVRSAQARSIDIDIDTGSEGTAFEGDGEVALQTPGRIELLPGAVWFSGLSAVTTT